MKLSLSSAVRWSAFVAGATVAALVARAETSRLWGERGEKWATASRLPDFSYAGYRRGEAALPNPPQVTNVRDFGAVGNGVADDTKAINAAIAATARGAVFLPPGRYRITDYIRIEKSGIVLRGAGQDKTTLWFPRGLDEVHPREGRTSTGAAASGYSFDGAFVQLNGDYRNAPLARIVALARRGDHAVDVDRVNDLSVGEKVLVIVRETPDHTLKTYLYDNDPDDIAKGKLLETKMVVTITAIDRTHVRFDRPLRFETRAEWRPEVSRFDPTVTESGIEDLRFEFPPARYRGHFKENGANAIELRQVHNCWVREVAFHNADLGINILGNGNTIDGALFTADSARTTIDLRIPVTGHHAIQIKHGEDNYVTHFDLRTSYIHDLSVEHANGNVFANGRGVNLNFDHHKDTPYENLFTAINCGAATRVWWSGGGESLGRPCAARGTFWSITALQPFTLPPDGWGPNSLNFVGLFTKSPSVLQPKGRWFEAIPPADLQPRNLHAAQLQRRLGQQTDHSPAK